MSNAIVNISQFKGLLNDPTFRAQMKNSMKENAGAFASSLLDLYSTDSSLQKCDPHAVMVEALKACALKLPIVKNLGFAYVVPFKNKPTFMIGYKGYIQLAQRTGKYRFINSGKVYEGMLIDDAENRLTGLIDIKGEKTSDVIVGYFAYIELLNGFKKSVYMTKDECEKYGKKYSPSYGSSYSPWQNEFDKMAEKTCLRQLISVFGYMSTEMQYAVSAEIEREKEILNADIEDEIKDPFTETDSRQMDIEDNAE